MKSRIDLNDVRLVLRMKELINGDSLDNIEWYDNGVKLEVSEDDIEEWKYVGLSNLAFAEIKLLSQEQYEPF